jgi:hypothetical protein
VFSGQASAWERDAARPHVAYVLPLTHLLPIVIEAAQFGDSFRSRIQCAVAFGYLEYLVLHDYG